ncbi:TrbI/VirB10 family protein, partial [Erwinia persicina]
MTDKPVPDEPEKTTAEREAEARERARAAMAYQEPEQRTSPGQPEVTRFRKVSGRRTLIVSLLSLTLVIALASGGDRLFSALKGGNEKEANTAPPPSAGKTLHERQNLGMDSNPFGLFGPHTQDGTDPVSQTVSSAPTLPPAPPALNKAAALADGVNNARTMPGDNAHTFPGETRSHADTSDSRSSSTTYTSCPSVLTRGKDGSLRCPETAAPESGNNDNPGVARVTGVRRLGLDPDLYIPVDRYIPCSMMWRFVSDVGGHISCLVSEDVYSASNHVTLIPAGTVARGIYRTGA